MYTPHVGRWISEDPTGFVDGPNAYLYVKNDPVYNLDPSGLFCVVCRWRRYANDEAFSDLGEGFKDQGAFGAVQNSAYSVYFDFFERKKTTFPTIAPAKAAKLIYDEDLAGRQALVRHPIVVFADVCFDRIEDCKVTGAEQRLTTTYNPATQRWTDSGWGQWLNKFSVTPSPILENPAMFKIVRYGELVQSAGTDCRWRILIYDEPAIEATLAAPPPNRVFVRRKNVRRRMTVGADYSITDGFILGWQGNEATGFSTIWNYRAGVSNADPTGKCC